MLTTKDSESIASNISWNILFQLWYGTAAAIYTEIDPHI